MKQVHAYSDVKLDLIHSVTKHVTVHCDVKSDLVHTIRKMHVGRDAKADFGSTYHKTRLCIL